MVFSENSAEKSAKARCQIITREIQNDVNESIKLQETRFSFNFVDFLFSFQENCFLVTSTEIKMQPSDAERITGSKVFKDLTDRGTVPVIPFRTEEFFK